MKKFATFQTVTRTIAQRLLSKSMLVAAMGLVGAMETGCSSLTTPISGIPARRLPAQYFAQPKNNLVPIDISRLTQEPPREYLLDKGDILGIYLEGVLPASPPDQPPELPPVNFPKEDSTLPPSLGFPIAVQEDGTIALPLIRPLNVRGLTVHQVRDIIRRAYTESGILSESENKIFTPIVTIIQERTYNVIVVRQDGGGIGQGGIGGNGGARGAFTRGSDDSATGRLVKLPAYQNDVLHALMQTGGLPGVNAKNEIQILRTTHADKLKRDEFVKKFYADYAANGNKCLCPPPLPDDPSILKIPLRLPPGQVPTFGTKDILLQEGDVVYIESRETEVYYTGGMLQGGEWLLPRDYDLDVIAAMSIAGQGIGTPSNRGAGGGGMGGGGLAQMIGGVPPGRLFILRKTPCNGQVTIEVDLARAINNPRERPLVQAGDTLILQYKPEEEALNFGLGAFFTYGIQQLLQNRNN